VSVSHGREAALILHFATVPPDWLCSTSSDIAQAGECARDCGDDETDADGRPRNVVRNDAGPVDAKANNEKHTHK